MEEGEQRQQQHPYYSPELIHYIKQYCLVDSDTIDGDQFPPTTDLDLNYKELVLGQSAVMRSIVGTLSSVESKRLDDSIKLYLTCLGTFSSGRFFSLDEFFESNSVPTRLRTSPKSIVFHLVGALGLGQLRTCNVIHNMVIVAKCNEKDTNGRIIINGDNAILRSTCEPSTFKTSLILALNDYISANQRQHRQYHMMMTHHSIPHDHATIAGMSTYKPFTAPPYIMIQIHHTNMLNVEQCESLKTLSDTGKLSHNGNAFELPSTTILLFVYITETVPGSVVDDISVALPIRAPIALVQRTLKKRPCQEKPSPTRKKFRYTKVRSENTIKHSALLSSDSSSSSSSNRVQRGLDDLDINRALTTFNQVLAKCSPKETGWVDIVEYNATLEDFSTQNTTKNTLGRQYSVGGCRYNPLFGGTPLVFVPYTHYSLKPIVENALSQLLIRSTDDTLGRRVSWLDLRRRRSNVLGSELPQPPIQLSCFIQDHGFVELMDSVLGYYDNNTILGVDGLIAFIDQQVCPSLVSLKEYALSKYISGNPRMFPIGFDVRNTQDYALKLEITCEKYESYRTMPTMNSMDPSTAIYVSSNTVMSSTTENSKYYRMLRCYSYVSTIDISDGDDLARQEHSRSLQKSLVGARILCCK